MSRCIASLAAVLLVTVASLSGCVRNENQPSSGAARPQVSSDTKSLDEMLLLGDVGSAVEALDAVKTKGFPQRDIQAVANAWRNHPTTLKVYATQTDRDLVTVSLADVLVQAVANGAWELEPQERETIRSVLREIAAGNSWPASMRAVSAIAFIDDAETTAFLANRATQGSNHYRAAVVALSLMCDPSAAESLSRLAKQVRDSDDKAFLLSTQEKYRKLKEDTSLCERRSRLGRVPAR